MLDRRDAIHHLLRLGLIGPEELVSGTVTATEYIGRNHLIRVEIARRGGYILKQPLDAGAPDATTMWTEAAVFWLSANEPAFAPLLPWMPKFYHYDERNAILTIELVRSSESLLAKLAAGIPLDPTLLRDVGRAFGTLHGSVSSILSEPRTRRLFRTGPAWALTLGSEHQHYRPSTGAAHALLGQVRQRADVLAALQRARASWLDTHIVHGDAKAANVLVLDDDSIRVIDWEIAALGDGLWDVAGLVHSLLTPTLIGPADPLPVAQRRARPLLDALWTGYLSALTDVASAGDRRVDLFRLTGVRMLQTCLESAQFNEQYDPSIASVLAMGCELLAHPEAACTRWQEAA